MCYHVSMMVKGMGVMIEMILEESFYSLERSDNLEYFNESEFIAYMKKILSEEEYAEFERLLNNFASEISRYWYQKGFHAARDIMREMLLTGEDQP